MLTATVSQTILDVLGLFQEQDRVFTAYDITVEARTKTQERVDHRDVREIVHNEWLTSQFLDNYERLEGVELKVNGNPFVIVYYPDIKTAFDHPLAMPASTPAPGIGASQPTPSISSVATPARIGGAVKQSDGSYVCSPTNEGRIEIPKDLISKVDSTGDSVDFLVSGDISCQSPDKKGRVRLALKKLGFSATDSVTVTISAGGRSITVSA